MPAATLVNYRPEYSHGWGGKTYYTQVRLDPLARESAEEMLTALLGVGAQQMGAKAYELRATMRLARLLARQGQRDEARTMLADILRMLLADLV